MNKSEQLIACLEGEIAKRDARIVEMQERFDSSAHRTSLIGRLEIENEQLRAELAAIKAQGVVMPTVDQAMRVVLREMGRSKHIRGTSNWCAGVGRAVLDEVARLNAAPIHRVSVPDDEAVMAKAREMFGWAYDLGCFPDAVRDLVAFARPAAPADDAGLVEALEIVAQWKLPETGQFWPSGGPVSYEAQWGSNGVRDYMRGVAQAAIAAHIVKGEA